VDHWAGPANSAAFRHGATDVPEGPTREWSSGHNQDRSCAESLAGILVAYGINLSTSGHGTRRTRLRVAYGESSKRSADYGIGMHLHSPPM
jgi:hypothetical protein